MEEIKIDPEFKELIPELSPEELSNAKTLWMY